MSGFYPLYVGASLSNSSQQVGMGLLRLYDTANGGFGSLAIYDSGIVFRDSANNIISIGGGGSGDMILASVQTVTGAKTFNDSTLLLANVAGTFSSKFTNTNTAARTYTLKDASGTVAFTSDITGTIAGSTGATDNRILRSDGTGGATVQNSAVTIDDSGNVTGVAGLTASGAVLANGGIATSPGYGLSMLASGVDGNGFRASSTFASITAASYGSGITLTAGLIAHTAASTTFSGSVTIGGGTAIAKVLSATATLDFPSISSNDTHTLTMTVTGAVAGNAVFIGVPAALDANLSWSASVTAADTVTIRMHNASGASVDPASCTYRATVFQF